MTMASLRAPILFLLAAASPLPAAAPAARETWPRAVGDWTVAVSKDGRGCFVTRSYAGAGGTTVLLGLDRDGTNHLSVLDADWSIRPKDRLKLDFRLSKGGYAKHFAIGIAADGKQGFVSSFEARFPAFFATSRVLYVARGEVPVARLDLTGSGAAVAELRRCVAARPAKPAVAAAREAGAASDIPRDPFARGAGRRSRE